MWRPLKGIRTGIVGLALTVSAWMAVIPQGMAQDLIVPSQVVSDYLTSLVNGDTQVLFALIGGRMKDKNRALALSPDSYSRFLKKHYTGVQTTVEEIVPYGDRMRAQVRFDYPTSDSSIIAFILSQVDGQWKITDEEY